MGFNSKTISKTIVHIMYKTVEAHIISFSILQIAHNYQRIVKWDGKCKTSILRKRILLPYIRLWCVELHVMYWNWLLLFIHSFIKFTWKTLQITSIRKTLSYWKWRANLVFSNLLIEKVLNFLEFNFKF